MAVPPYMQVNLEASYQEECGERETKKARKSLSDSSEKVSGAASAQLFPDSNAVLSQLAPYTAGGMQASERIYRQRASQRVYNYPFYKKEDLKGGFRIRLGGGGKILGIHFIPSDPKIALTSLVKFKEENLRIEINHETYDLNALSPQFLIHNLSRVKTVEALDDGDVLIHISENDKNEEKQGQDLSKKRSLES